MKSRKKIFSKRKLIYKHYKENLNNDIFEMQKIGSHVDFIPWTQAIYLKNKKITSRDLSKRLLNLGIETRNGFYSANRLPIYKSLKSKIKNSDFLSKNIICLPIFYDLQINEIKKICNYLNRMI